LFLRVAIVNPKNYREYRGAQSQFLHGLKFFEALVDTGATTTMISPSVVSDLELSPCGRLPLATISGVPHWPLAYLFHVGFAPAEVPGSSLGTSKVFSVHVHTAVIKGAELPSESGFDVLLGMDIISTGRLEVAPTGDFSFTFNESWLLSGNETG
jgi:hypothetical protein